MKPNKEFIEFIDNAKVEQLTEEDLDKVAGGAGTMYYGKPFVNERGHLVVDTVYVSGTATYDPLSKKISNGSNGISSAMSISADKLDAFLARQQERGNTLVSLDIAGKLR